MRQLLMRIQNVQQLPMPVYPDGYAVHTGERLDIDRWNAITESAFGMSFDFTDKMNRPGLTMDRLYFVSIDGVDVATACSYNHPDFPNEAFLHMVATHCDAKGRGAGKLVVSSLLKDLPKYGIDSCVLSTDDFRLPALKMYLSIGFMPIIDDDEMKQRWDKVFENLGKQGSEHDNGK